MKVRLDQEITIKIQDGEQLFLRAPPALKTLLGITAILIHHGPPEDQLCGPCHLFNEPR